MSFCQLIVPSKSSAAPSSFNVFENAENRLFIAQETSASAKRLVRLVQSYAGPSDVSIVLDKATAQIIVMQGKEIVAQNPALFGSNNSDFWPGGSQEAAFSLPIPMAEKKVTPAGTYKMAKMANDPDYGSSINFSVYKTYRLAIHRVYRGTPSERRPARLASALILDNFISFGCVNVSDEFYDQVIDKLVFSNNSFLFISPFDESKTDQIFPYLLKSGF